MARRKKRLPPSKKRYMEENPTVSIVLTRKYGLKQFIDTYMYNHNHKSYGKAVKELLTWCRYVYPKNRVFTEDDISFPFTLTNDNNLKQFVEWFMKRNGIDNYGEAIIRLLNLIKNAEKEYENIKRQE